MITAKPAVNIGRCHDNGDPPEEVTRLRPLYGVSASVIPR